MGVVDQSDLETNELSRARSRSSARPSTRTWPSGSTAGALEGFREQAVAEATSTSYDVPGAFELPLAAKACAESGRYAGVACLGAVIRGETDHYDYVCEAATYGIEQVQLDTGVPVRLRGADRRRHGPGAGAHGRREAGPATTPPLRDAFRWRGWWPRCGRLLSSARRAAAPPSSTLPRDAEGMSRLRQGPGVRAQPQSLDGRDQAALQPEPAEGPHRRRRHSTPGLRLHALPEGGQGGQSGLDSSRRGIGSLGRSLHRALPQGRRRRLCPARGTPPGSQRPERVPGRRRRHRGQHGADAARRDATSSTA